ncbi:hypothetical protein VNO78_18566 [Psophocarpus tetragonolobus]|uniref:Uncharacterized protein n=1 Tax=Psophocarpus tetragonolobus TaxID=3891 RepID=A0AAN9XLY5_PSOTE
MYGNTSTCLIFCCIIKWCCNDGFQAKMYQGPWFCINEYIGYIPMSMESFCSESLCSSSSIVGHIDLSKAYRCNIFLDFVHILASRSSLPHRYFIVGNP